MFTSVEGAMAAAIGWFYLVTNAARVFAYFPQIAAVWRCRDGAFAISILTWGLWTISHVAALLYGALVMNDLYFVGITTVNLLGCGAVTALTAWRRVEFGRAQLRSGDEPSTPPRSFSHEWRSRLYKATAFPRLSANPQWQTDPLTHSKVVKLGLRTETAPERGRAGASGLCDEH